MFIAALFTIAKLSDQLTCPTTNEMEKKMLYIHNADYSAMKKNEVMPFAGKRMDLDN
jgi:hypothetical protein